MVGLSPPASALETWAYIANIVEAVAVTSGTLIAVFSINAWRRQTVGARRIDVAERAMLAFHELSESLVWLRSRLDLAPGENSVVAFERQRSEYYNRMMASLAFDNLVSQLAGQQPLFAVYFGQEAVQPFDTIIALTRTLQFDIREAFANVPAENRELKDKATLLNRIGWGNCARPDEIDRTIAGAVADVAAICNPVLEGRR